MIARTLQALGLLFGYICVATVLAQCAVVGSLWVNGGFDPDRRLRLSAYLAGVDRQAIREELLAKQAAAVASSGHIDRLGTMRRQAMAASSDQVRMLEAQLLGERQRYETIRGLFESRLEQLEVERTAAAIETVRATLEVLDPETSKNVLMEFLEDGAIEDVVTIVTRMPADRQRKIFGEFRSPIEVQQLNDVLLRIRGNPRDATADDDQTGAAP